MRLYITMTLAAAFLALAGCTESQRSGASRQPVAAPQDWEGGMPLMSGMGTTPR
jgi:hypothetical protein